MMEKPILRIRPWVSHCARVVMMGLLPAIMFSCASSKITYSIDERTGQRMELGWIERNVLESEYYAWFDSGYQAYHPEIPILEGIREQFDSLHFLIVLGTWCSDTKRELPRVVRILDEMNVPPDHIKLYAVDRGKQSPPGIPQEYEITNVPTIIVLHHGREIGRIVESPLTSLEIDLAEIVGPLLH